MSDVLTGAFVGFPSDVGDFNIGNSPIEGAFHRGPYSSAIGLFCIGYSPIGLLFTPVPAPALSPGA